MIIDTSAEPERKSRTRTFRKFEPPVRYSPDQARRLDDLLRCAWSSLRCKDAAIAFLNTPHESLGGKPMSVAVESDAGLQTAKSMLNEIRDASQQKPQGVV